MYPCDIYCVAFKPPSYRWIPPPYYVYAISFTHGCRAQKAMAERHAHTCKFARTHVPGVLLNWHYSLLRYVHTLSPGTVRHVNAPGLLHMSWTWKPITYHIPYHPYPHPHPHPSTHSAFNVDTDTFDSLTHTAMQAILRLCVCGRMRMSGWVWMVWMVWHVICDGFSCPWHVQQARRIYMSHSPWRKCVHIS